MNYRINGREGETDVEAVVWVERSPCVLVRFDNSCSHLRCCFQGREPLGNVGLIRDLKRYLMHLCCDIGVISGIVQ